MISEEMRARIDAHNPSRVVVAYSGGLDSHVLLHLAVNELPAPVCALHVNHGLNPGADGWQEHCERTAEQLGIQLAASRVSVRTTGSIEENARDARYEVFGRFLAAGDLLLLAHHADDQIETAMLSLFRGTARPGVTAMPVERRIANSWLIRPLLDRRRAELEAYAKRHELRWIEDESNLDPGFDRNYIRHHVLDVIRGRWPEVDKALLSAVSRDEEFLQLIDSIAESDLVSLQGIDGGIALDRLVSLPVPRRHNLIRFWLARFSLPLPSSAMLTRGLDSMIEARDDATPLLSWQGICLRRFNGSLYLTEQLDDARIDEEYRLNPQKTVLPIGELTAEFVKGRGISQSLTADGSVRFRKGGERLRLGAESRTLKNLFQEHGVPSWLRDHMPLIYVGDELVAVAGLPSWGIPMLTSGAAVVSGDEMGVEFSFSIPNQPYS
jgi:tRNA(Ile)-lysidine synthase